jgi:uncharacterized protein (DUF488 family)
MDRKIFQIFTIGYQSRSIRELISKLHENGITLLVDIRDNPHSRNRDFSKGNLAKSLNQAGIAYFHLKELGSPAWLRQNVRESGDYEYFFAAYEKYLDTQSDTLSNIYNLLDNMVICLLCYERNPQICHRKSVADRLSRMAWDGQEITLKHL